METQTITRAVTPVWYKTFSQKAVEVNEQSRKVCGMLAAFGNIDDGRDMLIKGCFAKSIAEHGPGSDSDRKIVFLWAHDSKDPIGRFTKLEETDEGLYFEAELDDVPSGNRALKQYASGTLNQHSIGFNYAWDKIEYVQDGDFFLVKEVKLYEGSVVPFGMNENTPFMGFKSLVTDQPDLMAEIESELKTIPAVSQPQIRKLIQKIVSLLKSEPGDTSLVKEPITAQPLSNNPEPMQMDKLINSFTLNF